MLDRNSRTPVLTALACAICVMVFLGINFGGSHSDAELRRWGLYSGEDLYGGGAYWSLITTAFVHVQPIHLIFNLMWLWALGGAFERRFGPAAWLAFVLGAAFVSSGVELFAGELGIGMSGVGYALFGFGWLTRHRLPEFQRIVTDQTVMMFVAWGILCIVTTYMGVMNIANLAHGAGFVFGAGLGMIYGSTEGRAVPLLGFLALSAASFVPIFYNPRSVDWTAKKAEDAFDRRQYNEAAKWYRHGLDIGARPQWAWANLAITYAAQQNVAEVRKALAELAKVDPPAAKELEETLFEEPGKGAPRK